MHPRTYALLFGIPALLLACSSSDLPKPGPGTAGTSGASGATQSSGGSAGRGGSTAGTGGSQNRGGTGNTSGGAGGAAGSAGGAVGGSAGSPNPPGCGDGNVEGTEACDDKNDKLCDGCELCEKRYVLSVPKGAYATIAGLKDFLPAPEKEVCFSAWVKTDGSVSNAVYFASAASDTDINFLVQCTGATVEFTTRNGDKFISVRPPAPRPVGSDKPNCHDAQWHHISACRTITGQDLSLRIQWDGQIIGSAGGKLDAIGTPAPVYIGGTGTAQNGLGGFIDEVSISTRVNAPFFTPVRREEVMSSTIALYHLDEGAGSNFEGVGEHAAAGVLSSASFVVDSGYTATMCQ